MKLALSRIQKRTLVFVTLASVYANTHVRSNGFDSSQGFPFVFRHGSDAGPSEFNGQLFLTDVAIAISLLSLLLSFLTSNKEVATRAQMIPLMVFSALYYWMNVDAWFGWPMAWIWNSRQTFTYGFPFAYDGRSGGMHVGSPWAIILNIVIGVVGYRLIDRAFTNSRLAQLPNTPLQPSAEKRGG
jgi:hypothetical protein